MSTKSNIKARHLKFKKCPECDDPLRLCEKGIICTENHLFGKESELWLDIEALATGIPRYTVVSHIEAGFMMRESSGRAGKNKQEYSDDS